MSTTAKVKHPWEFIHDEIAWNDRMPNINAALGVSQLEILDKKLDLKQRLHEEYIKHFKKIDEIRILKDAKGTKSNNWLITGMITKESREESKHIRNQILEKAIKKGIGVRPLWRPLHLLEIYKSAEQDNLKITEELYDRILNFPSSPQIMENNDKIE